MNILIPIDFSDSSIIAVKFAWGLKKKNPNLNLHYLHVASQSRSKHNYLGDKYTKLSKEGAIDEFNIKLTKLIESDSNPDNNSRQNFSLRFGGFYRQLSYEILKKDITFIVMGTSGASKMQSKLFGSNAFNLIKKTSVPVLAIPVGSKFDSIDGINLCAKVGSDFKFLDEQMGRTNFLSDLPLGSYHFVLPGKQPIELEGVKNIKVKKYSEIMEILGGFKNKIIAIKYEPRGLIQRLSSSNFSYDITHFLDNPILVFK